MKPHHLFTTLVICFMVSYQGIAQFNTDVEPAHANKFSGTDAKKKLNFFIVSKRKKGKLDLATRYNVLRTKIKSFFRPKSFVAIVASNTEKASSKILHRLKKYNALIGTLWFDSHGAYKKGYSFYMIGHDEISTKTLQDSCYNQPLYSLAAYTNQETKLVLGSCYSGATYLRLSIDYKDTSRMNGDSLMINLGKIFQQTKIYASESWVMTKPGLFNNKKKAVAGFPRRKLFRDVCYRPAWENVGKWNELDASKGTFKTVGAVSLDSYGHLQIREGWDFNNLPFKNHIVKNLHRLDYDLYK